MTDPYRRNLARDRYYQDMAYGQYYDDVTAYHRNYNFWADNVNARDDYARSHAPAYGSYEEHMAGLGSWTYGVDPHRAWWYGPRPSEEAVGRRDRYAWGPAEEELAGYPWYHGRSRHRDRGQRYEYVYPHRRERYEVVDPGWSSHRRRCASDVLDDDDRVPLSCVVERGGRRGRRSDCFAVPRSRGHRGFQTRKMRWKDWSNTIIADDPERHGFRVKRKPKKWNDWPKTLIGDDPERYGFKVKRKFRKEWKDWPGAILD